MERTLKCKTFYGNEVSDYGKEHNRVDYGTLAKSFDAVLNNNIFSKGWEFGEWEQVNGFVDYSEDIEELREQIEELEEEKEELEEGDLRLEEIEADIEELEDKITDLEEEQERANYEQEIFQWYIIDGNGAEILEYWTDEIVYYNYALDMYVWGVTHFGTSWSYVLTDIKIEEEE